MLLLITSYILTYLLVILSIPLASFCTVYRYFVGLYLSHKYKQQIEFATGFDAAVSIDVEKSRYNMGGCQVLQGRADFEKVRRRIEERLLQPRVNGTWKHGKLRKVLKREFGYFFWISQNDFRVENHVVMYDGPIPENHDDFKKCIANILMTLPTNKGIYWQFVVIDLPHSLTSNLPDPHHIVFLVIYHGLADAISISRLFRTVSDDVYNPPKLVPKSLNEVGLVDQVKFWAKGFIFGPYELFRDLLKSEEKHCLYGSELTGKKLASFSDPIPLERIKRIKTITKLTVNEVLITCVVGGIRAYFEWKKEVVPRNLSVYLPVSLHDFRKEPKLENKIAALKLPMPIDEPKCRQRLLKTKTAINKLKSASDLATQCFMMHYYINRLPLLFAEMITAMMRSSAVVTCFPMPSPENFLGNKTVMQTLCFGVSNGISGCGLSVAIPSEEGNVMFTVNADSGIMKSQENLDKLIEFMEMEVDALEKEFVINGFK